MKRILKIISISFFLLSGCNDSTEKSFSNTKSEYHVERDVRYAEREETLRKVLSNNESNDILSLVYKEGVSEAALLDFKRMVDGAANGVVVEEVIITKLYGSNFSNGQLQLSIQPTHLAIIKFKSSNLRGKHDQIRLFLGEIDGNLMISIFKTGLPNKNLADLNFMNG